MLSLSSSFSGCAKALERISYERVEDCAKHNIKYAEVRYCPQLFANTGTEIEYCTEKGTLTPRDVVRTINKGLARGMKEFGVTVKSILCIMTHIPGKFSYCTASNITAQCVRVPNRTMIGCRAMNCLCTLLNLI